MDYWWDIGQNRWDRSHPHLYHLNININIKTLWFNLRTAFQIWLAQIKTVISKGKQRDKHWLKTFFVDYSSRRNWFNRPFPCCLMCVWHILPFQSSVYRGKQWTLQLALRLWRWGGSKCHCCVTRKSFWFTSISKLFDFANCFILITQLPKNWQAFNIFVSHYITHTHDDEIAEKKENTLRNWVRPK